MYCAIAMNFSWIQSWHNSDTVIPALVSIEKYSLFYWSENRFGMLVPLLASVVRDYGWNLLIQSQLIVAAGIGTVVVIDVLTARQSSTRTVRVTLAALLLLLFYKPQAALVLLLPGSPYLMGLFLTVGALCVLLRTSPPNVISWIIGGVLLLLAFWVNPSNVVMAGAAVVLWPGRNLRFRAGVLALIITAAGIVMTVSTLFPGTDVRQPLPPAEWLASLLRVFGKRDIDDARHADRSGRFDGRRARGFSSQEWRIQTGACNRDRRSLPDRFNERVAMGCDERVRLSLYRRTSAGADHFGIAQINRADRCGLAACRGRGGRGVCLLSFGSVGRYAGLRLPVAGAGAGGDRAGDVGCSSALAATGLHAHHRELLVCVGNRVE